MKAFVAGEHLLQSVLRKIFQRVLIRQDVHNTAGSLGDDIAQDIDSAFRSAYLRRLQECYLLNAIFIEAVHDIDQIRYDFISPRTRAGCLVGSHVAVFRRPL